MNAAYTILRGLYIIELTVDICFVVLLVKLNKTKTRREEKESVASSFANVGTRRFVPHLDQANYFQVEKRGKKSREKKQIAAAEETSDEPTDQLLLVINQKIIENDPNMVIYKTRGSF